MKLRTTFCMVVAAALIVPAFAASDVSVDPKTLGKPPINSWPTFNGDYTGQRFSTLKEINATNVGQITQQWVYKITSVGAQRGAAGPVIKSTPLLVNGMLYITIPD